MSTPYREAGKPFQEAPEDPTDPYCTCGHLSSKHHFFNGDLVDCQGLGMYNETLDKKTGKMQRHQWMGVCPCDRFRVGSKPT